MWHFDQVSINDGTIWEQSWKTLSFYFSIANKFATLIADVHCFSHEHVLFIFNMNYLLIVLFCYPPFVVDAFTLGSQHMTF